MIGRKKLSILREELQSALAATGDDPIRWLEKRMSSPERPGSSGTGESEILQSLQRVLEASAQRKPRRPRLKSTK
jgi:hypothetical protein